MRGLTPAFPFVVFLSAVAAPAAVAPLPQAATALRAEDLRVATVAYRLGREGRAFCPGNHPLAGLLLHHLPEYDAAGRAVQIQRHALDRGPGVLATVENSPASRSGLMAGDVLLGVNGKDFPDPRVMAAEADRKIWRKMIEAAEAELEDQLRLGPARLRVLRGGTELDFTLRPEAGCPIRIRLARSNQLNAFADGRYVVVTTRILDFVRNDDELATIIGHELAHNILEHKDRLDAQQVPRGILRSFGKNAPRVRATEEEADRLGLRLAWSAGYDVREAVLFWRRLHAAHGPRLPIFRTHPSLKMRERLVSETVAALGTPPPRPARSE